MEHFMYMRVVAYPRRVVCKASMAAHKVAGQTPLASQGSRCMRLAATLAVVLSAWLPLCRKRLHGMGISISYPSQRTTFCRGYYRDYSYRPILGSFGQDAQGLRKVVSVVSSRITETTRIVQSLGVLDKTRIVVGPCHIPQNDGWRAAGPLRAFPVPGRYHSGHHPLLPGPSSSFSSCQN